MTELAVVSRQVQAGDGLAGHDVGSALGQGHARCLRDEGHGAAGAGVDLDDVDLAVLDAVLDVHQAAGAHCQRQALGALADLVDDALGEAEGRGAAGRVAGVDAGLLDVLEDAADVDLGAVAEGVDVALGGGLEEGVEVDGVVRRDAGGLCHVLLEVLLVIGDDHAAAAQHIAGAHQQRVAHFFGHLDGLLDRRGGAGCGVGDAHLVEQGRKALAVLCQVDGLGLGAHDVHALVLQGLRQLERGLAAQGDHHAVGLLCVDDVHHVLVGDGLEVEAVGGVVVGGDGFGVAVDHDGLVAQVVQGVGGMDAAVVELDALADAVGARADDHGLLLAAGSDLGLLVVGLVVVAGLGGELGGAGVDGLEDAHHAQLLAARADLLLGAAGEAGDLHVRKTVALAQAHQGLVDRGQLRALKALLDGDHVAQAVDEPDVDAGELGDFLGLEAAAQGLGHVVDAVLGGHRDVVAELRLVEGVLAVAAQAHAAVLEGAHGLAQRLLEGAADGHDLAHGLHASGEHVVGALELLEGEARHLGDHVVDRGLEACRGGLGDVVGDFVEGVAHGQLGGHLGNGEARGLGCQRRRARHAGVHLDDDEAAVLGVDGELHVGAAALDADLLEDGQRCVAHLLVLDIGEGLGRGHGDGVAGVHAHGVKVLDGADDDAVAHAVAHDLHLVLFPADDGLLDQHLAGGRQVEALAHDIAQLVAVVGDAAAGAAQGEGGAQHQGEAQLVCQLLCLGHAVGVAAARALKADALHGLGKELAILALLDGLQVAADELDAVLVEHAAFCQGDGAVEAGLAAHVGQQGVRALLGDDVFDGLGGDGLDVGAGGGLGVGHDGGRVGVDEDDLVALLHQDAAGLGAGIVELAGLADHNGTGTDEQDLFDVSAARH